ncbi:MAG: hypothetical protein JOZ84_02770 [Methylobacteriaceae bacterium]|nr:hypothetical protein [Solirubrobacterales bacterium]MBV9393312.1 hypothetical protein [Methylobacteriaceae bacterium]
MADILSQVSYSAPSVGGSGAIIAGYGVCKDPTGQYFVLATTSNLAAIGEQRAIGVALATVSTPGTFPIQVTGVIPASIANIGTGTAGDYVITTATGALARSPTVTSTAIGVADMFGAVFLGGATIGAVSSNATIIQGYAVGVPSLRGSELGFDGPSNIQWQLPNELNVLRFGADRSGVADSRPAFLAAISALLSYGSGGVTGGTIVVPPGVYNISAPITLADQSSIASANTGIRLRGAGGATAFSGSLATLMFNFGDTRKYGGTITAVSAGFATATFTAGSFAATDVDCSIRIWGDTTNEANNGTFTTTQVGPAGDGSQITYYNPSAVAGATINVCVGHVGLDIRASDCWLENLRLVVGSGKLLTALADWTQSASTGTRAITRLIIKNCFFGCFNYATTHARYNLRVARDFSTGPGIVPTSPPNCDYLKIYDTQFWQADEAHIGIISQTAQSRANAAINCDFIYGPNGIWAKGGTSFELYSPWVGGNAPIKFMEAAFALNGSTTTFTVVGLGSEGATGLYRITNGPANIGGQLTLSKANMRKDQVIGEIFQNQSAISHDGLTIVTSDVDQFNVYATGSTSFETTVNFIKCTLPSNVKPASGFEPRYMPSQNKGPLSFQDGDVLTFTVDGLTKTCTLHTTGSSGVPKDLDGVRRWRFGVSGSTILEAQFWELAQLIEEQIPGLGAVAYGDQSQMRLWSNSGASGSLTAAYPLGASDPNHKLNWAAGTYNNTAPSQCSIDTGGFVGPGLNNSSAMIGNTFINSVSRARTPGANRLVVTGSAASGGGTVISGLVGIGGGKVARNNLSGQVTVSAGSTTGTATFTTNEVDASYKVLLTPVSSPGTSGCQTVVSYTKATTGFTITVAAAPVGSPVVFDWVLIG